MKHVKRTFFYAILIVITIGIALLVYRRLYADADTAYVVTSRVVGTGNTNLTEINKEDAKFVDTQTEVLGKGNISKVRYVSQEMQPATLVTAIDTTTSNQAPTIISIGVEGNKNILQGRIGAAGENIIIQGTPIQVAKPIQRGRGSV